MSTAFTDTSLTDPDSLHYARVNSLSRYRQIKDSLSGEDRDDWLEWFEGALGDEIQYAADNRNNPRRIESETGQ